MRNTILNDPIYGLIEIPKGIIMDLIEHPFFQRLRRISQLGVTHYVYPGATHSRFSHCVGAMHLTQQALETLQCKGVSISEAEAEAVTIAILLHDLGHGPFSHSLEHQLISIHHEDLSLLFMEQLNQQFKGKLSLAIQIFKNEYSKKFLYQLVSGQLDMDRLDYLCRDSFFTGVVDGKVSYDRIIKTLNVHNDNLVVEYKGIYSIENFLMARRLMYWQVYLHKNVICASVMLTQIMKRARYLTQKGMDLELPKSLDFFFSNNFCKEDLKDKSILIGEHFQQLDDADILVLLKRFAQQSDFVLAYLSKSLLDRKLFKIDLKNEPISSDIISKERLKLVANWQQLSTEEMNYLIVEGQEANRAYKKGKTEIQIKLKDGSTRPISKWKEHSIKKKEVVKYYACYPKFNISLIKN